MIPSLPSCLVKWKEGAWGRSSRQVDRISPHGWQIPATWPWVAISGTHHTDVDGWKEKQSLQTAPNSAYTFKFDCWLVETAKLKVNNFVTFSIKLNPRTQKKGKIICQIMTDHLPRKEWRQKAEGEMVLEDGIQFKGMHLTSLEFLEGWWRDFDIF